jgi:hypothetical protein
VGQLFGSAAAAKFGPMWSSHIVSVVDYAAAVAEQDEAARAEVRQELGQSEVALADFFAGASGGRLPVSAARSAVAMHVKQLTGQADAYAARDYVTADRIYREGYEHAYDLGGALAGALLPAADRACGVQILSQGGDLGIGRSMRDDGVLRMNAFK